MPPNQTISEVTIVGDINQPKSVDSDTVTAVFNLNTDNDFSIDNFTSYTIERDFFVPADAFSLTIADDRADQIRKDVVVGSPLSIAINGHIQLIGYVEKVDYQYSRGGSSLTISGRDKLGLMADSIVPPNNDYNAKTTIKQIILDLISDFGIISGTYSIADQAELSVATAGLVGIANRAKTPKAIAKSWLRSVNRQIKPRKEEGYLEYLMRISKEVGLNIKLLPGTNKIFVNTPIYDRTSQPLYELINIFQGSRGNTGFSLSNLTNQQNNIITGSINIDYKKQPSIIVSEMSGATQPTFRRDSIKIVQVNEITGFNSVGIPYPSVSKVVDLLSKTYGYYRIPESQELISLLPGLLSNQPSVIGTIARPAFLFDEHATTLDELHFFTLKKMAEKQNEFLKLEYLVKDHTYNGVIWNTNLMCSIFDDRFQVYGKYWIQKTVFKKTRAEGTTTELSLRLPYIWEFYTID